MVRSISIILDRVMGKVFMDTKELQDLWNHLVPYMLSHTQDSAKTLEGFLGVAQPVDMVDNTLVIAVKTDFSRSYITSHYFMDISNAVVAILGYPCEITIKTMSEVFENTSPAPSQIPYTPQQPPKENTQPVISRQSPQITALLSASSEHDSHQEDQNTLSEQHINKEGHYNPKFTFASFVVAESNNFARAAALKVAEAPGKSYNPLFIFGNPGLGKTHLLNAIANYIFEVYPYMRVLYVTSEDFVNDVVSATRFNLWIEFTNKYRDIDVLLLDDIQFLGGKEASILQLFNTFNQLISYNKAIVLSADRAPRDLDMDERLRSRFVEGLLVEVSPPSFETRYAILQNYIEREANNLFISDDILMYIARISTSNIRELDGAIARIIAFMNINNKTNIEVDEAKTILNNFFPEQNTIQINISTIQNVVEKFYGINHSDLIGTKRTRNINTARQIAMYLSRQMTEKSFPDIGLNFGRRDHTTIMHGVTKIEKAMKESEEVYKQLEQLTSIINEQTTQQR